MSAHREGGTPGARALAPAKINPLLEVLHARPDGYHEVRTFLVAVDLYDEVEARANDRGAVSLSVDGPMASADVPHDERNLAWRAAAACLALAHERGLVRSAAGVDLRLLKRIPSQAGLGGASSDAAAAWAATAAALRVEPDPTERDRALALLGSDTVFFARAAATGAAWCTGRGERVAPAPAPRGWSIALITPSVPCPTARVYAHLGSPLSGTGTLPTLKPVDWSSIPAHEARHHLANRLEPAALAAVEDLRPWRLLLDDAGGSHFRLSGSGSSFFGLYENDAAARAMLQSALELSHVRGLASRFCDIVHPCEHGVRLLTER